MYEWDNHTGSMYLIAKGENAKPIEKTLINPHKGTGVMLRIEKVIKHVQELRSIGYSIINGFLIGNAVLATEFLNQKFKALPSLLVRDVQILPDVLA
jgi:hypothetical protein